MKKRIKNSIESFAYKHPNTWREISKTVRFFRCMKTAYYRKNLTFKKDGKIRVAFIINMPEVWTSLQPVYEQMSVDPRFETYIIAQPKRISNPAVNDAFAFLNSKYLNVINAYMGEGQWFDPKQLNIEYTFYTRPYNEYHPLLEPSETRKYSITCHIPYGYILSSGDIFDTCYNGSFLCNCSVLFDCSRSALNLNYKRFGLAAKARLINLEFLGFPRFDLLQRNNGRSDKKNGEFTILWTPRFPTPGNGFNIAGHFLDYYKDLIQYAQNNEGVRVIIRPHPLMFERFRSLRILTADKIEKIKREIEEAKNVEFDVNKDYRISFEKADLLVSDFSSLIIEYYYLDKPIILCDDLEDLLEEAARINQTIYHCSDWNEMKHMIDGIKAGNDPLSQKRSALIDELAEVNESSGHRIIEYIASDYVKHSAKQNK